MQLQKKHKFPLKNNECRKEHVKYEAKIESNNDNKVYIGLTENEIKKTIADHKAKFNIDPDKKNHLSIRTQLNYLKRFTNNYKKKQIYLKLWIIIKQIRKTRQGKAANYV